MDARKLILLVGALVVAAITAFMARNLMVGAPTPVAGAAPGRGAGRAEHHEVLVATRSLPPGTILGSIRSSSFPGPRT